MADLRGDQLPLADLPLTTEPTFCWQGSEMRRLPAIDLANSVDDPIAVTVSRDLADSDQGRILRCTSGVTLTVVTGLTTGFACMVLNRAGTNVTFAAGGGMTLDGDLTVGDKKMATIVKDAAAAALINAAK